MKKAMSCPACGAALDASLVGGMLARKGRAVNSPAQQQASRANGKKGGRPKKVIIVSPPKR